MAHDFAIFSLNHGLLEGIVANSFGFLGRPGK